MGPGLFEKLNQMVQKYDNKTHQASKPKVLEIREGKDRLVSPLSCFRGVVNPDTSVNSFFTLKDYFKEMVKPSKELQELTDRARAALEEGDLVKYKEIKEGNSAGSEQGAPAVIPGRFSHRR